MSYEAGSSLQDVVGSDPTALKRWTANRVEIKGFLTEFHTKYWGPGKKSMKDEKAEWHKSQIKVDKMDVDDDGDSDITDDCYVLDISIKGVQPEKIWIRAEYKRIYDKLESWLNIDPTGMAPSVVITGQPGIGKSVWIYYAVRRRLGEQKPVIWYYGGQCYLFVNEGVFQKPDDFLPAYFKRLVWTLVDSEAAVPARLVDYGTRLFVIFTTSPNKSRWKDLHKSTRSVRCIMNPWTRGEMLQLVSINNLPVDSTTTIHDTFGPTPRIWKDLNYPDILAQYEFDVHQAIKQMTSSELERLINATETLSMDAVSHKLFLIRRMDLDQPLSLQTVAPITPSIRSRLANRSRYMARSDLINLYKIFAESRQLAGMMFEALGQQLLQDKITLDMVPMVQLRKVSHGKPQWNSSHVSFVNMELETSRQEALRHTSYLDVKPAEVIELAGTPPSIEEGIYYLPKNTNQVAIDSFFVFDGILYLFQFTIAGHHDVKPRLKTFLEACPGIPAASNWRFVFIIPLNETVVCPQLPPVLGEVPVYSAVIAVEV